MRVGGLAWLRGSVNGKYYHSAREAASKQNIDSGVVTYILAYAVALLLVGVTVLVLRRYPIQVSRSWSFIRRYLQRQPINTFIPSALLRGVGGEAGLQQNVNSGVLSC